MNFKFYITLIAFLFICTLNTGAQGCVAVRQMGGLSLSPSDSYNLLKGNFQMGANYRYFHSWRHFVGTEEQPQRQVTGGGHDANGNDRGNAVNIYSHALDLNFSYGLSNRLQLNATIPYVHNERSQVLRQTAPEIDTFRYSVYAAGIGDMRIGLNYWLFDPEMAQGGNLMVGLGIKLPTGRFDATDNQVPQSDGTKKDFIMMDQAIQPGDGGLGFSVELQAFRQLFTNFYGFANGYYMFNPRESNGAYKSAPSVIKSPIDNTPLGTLTGYNLYASPDQYFVRAGVMTNVFNKLTVSLAGRWEGIPAYDAIGGQIAYRRPGYVVSIEPGLAFRTGNHSFSIYVPKNIIRNRIQSAADIAQQDLQNSVISNPLEKVHVQGDAAFADYSISIGYAYRFSGKTHSEDMTVPSN
ncbi:MAG TPA: hypothetical protein VFG10_16585 [Saprospiraceae bacterium]|nr:hypothetical protein [Saprospiraceae bacterium]